MPAEPVQISWAKDAERIGKDTIDRFHRHLQNEDEVRISYIYTSKKRTKGGRTVQASTKRMTPVEVFLLYGSEATETGEEVTEVFHYLVTISIVEWAILDERKRAALIDHELAHIIPVIGDEGELSFTLRDHTIQEFPEVLERNGFWATGLKEFAEIGAKQLALWTEGARL